MFTSTQLRASRAPLARLSRVSRASIACPSRTAAVLIYRLIYVSLAIGRGGTWSRLGAGEYAGRAGTAASAVRETRGEKNFKTGKHSRRQKGKNGRERRDLRKLSMAASEEVYKISTIEPLDDILRGGGWKVESIPLESRFLCVYYLGRYKRSTDKMDLSRPYTDVVRSSKCDRYSFSERAQIHWV